MGQENNSKLEFELHDHELMVSCVGANSQVVYSNPVYQRVTGYSLQESQAMQGANRLRDVPPQVLADLGAAVRQGKPWSGLIKLACKSERLVWCRLNAAPLLSHGQYIGSLMVLSKPAQGEIERYETLYRRLHSDRDKKLGWEQGRIVPLNLLGKITRQIRSLGLKRYIWGCVFALAMVAILVVAINGNGLASFAFLAEVCTILLSTVAAGAFLSRAIALPLQDAVQAAMKMAAGDLCASYGSERCDEIGDVMRTLNQVSINMRATVLDVRNGVAAMRQATTEIAAGTMELSGRTETQASSLEETAASMEEINSTVGNNADAAGQASDLATLASEAAEDGGLVVNQVIATMAQIKESSRKISDIISVIDGIAFQTNILALNAAVEAARAGEQGRGFAVVAGEVRNLAQRSAQAAKEIKALITQSVETVDDGSKLVDSAGKTIAEIVSQVRGVTDLVGQIARASREQSAGVGLVSQAVEQLDQMTQVNATLVQVHTEAAGNIKQQTERLAEMLCVFTLSRDERNLHLSAPGD
ncbi:methyl-accepting chemotaxis sensory transducer with Pas/Pac sensor [Trinickia symbiotica]|uniref:Chemotaxis protein n=1 Tax=Trinickia symbiotica TaxID=863227 RepID=A0A2N7X582_9BURK|nr:methyl-accepting chemotaxis protein [Trinickia symbiotica]PMS36770.1 chemotaxis protein [Trinickia symbiotica]PPK46217.1 methyl-accepting chemotaxis sensory transducer with Pas/Pac sensor [Trinickia symbiotica]